MSKQGHQKAQSMRKGLGSAASFPKSGRSEEKEQNDFQLAQQRGAACILSFSSKFQLFFHCHNNKEKFALQKCTKVQKELQLTLATNGQLQKNVATRN